MNSYVQKLKEWYDQKRIETNGNIDLKIYSGTNRDALLEDVAKEVYEVLTGQRKTVDETNTVL